MMKRIGPSGREVIDFMIDALALILLVGMLLLLSGCGEPPAPEPTCPTTYCVYDGTQILWDACRPHPHFDSCGSCHHPHQTPFSPAPCP